jgi:TonB family protein
VIFYRPAERLPEVATRELDHATGKPKVKLTLPVQAISVDSPKSVDGKQFIWQPAPKIMLQNEVRSPNLLAFTPAPARPVRPFVAPEGPKVAPERPRAALPEASPLAVAPPTPAPLPLAAAVPGPPKPPTREFVPPPGKSSPQTGPAAALDVAPSLPLSTEPRQASLAVIGLDPSRTPEIPQPEGSRPTRISAGPDATVAGSEHAAPIVIPGLNIGGPGATNPATVVEPSGKNPEPFHEPSPAEWAKASPGPDSRRLARSMMSAALRPSSRVIAPGVEVRFPDRSVYTTSFEVGADAAEWVIWFALKTAAEGLASVRPPVPWSRPSEPPGSRSHTGRVEIAASIDREGHTTALTVVRCSDEALRATAAQVVQEWEFLPALRNGEPVAVDVLIDINFRPRQAK